MLIRSILVLISITVSRGIEILITSECSVEGLREHFYILNFISEILEINKLASLVMSKMCIDLQCIEIYINFVKSVIILVVHKERLF
jgi:hypothetical protein